jgi:hypothetical protein
MTLKSLGNHPSNEALVVFQKQMKQYSTEHQGGDAM